MNIEINPPNSIIVLENLIGVRQDINYSTDKYQALLFENVFDSTFIVSSKLIKIILVRCNNVTIILKESLLSSVEIFESRNVSSLLTKEVPIITIERSNTIKLYSHINLNFLNTYSDEIYIIWGENKIQKVPLILFSNSWLWNAPYNSDWINWTRTEINFLIQEHVLYGF
jgi:hypothetical protein